MKQVSRPGKVSSKKKGARQSRSIRETESVKTESGGNSKQLPGVYAVVMPNNAMNGNICEGDVLLLDVEHKPKRGEVVYVHGGDYYLVRRLKSIMADRIELTADNDAFSSFAIQRSMCVLYPVVGVIHNFRGGELALKAATKPRD